MAKVQSGVKSVHNISGQLRKTGDLFCFVLLEFEKLPANIERALGQHGNSAIYYRSHRD